MRKLNGILILLFAVHVFSQESPFIPPEVDNALRNEISGDIAFEDLRLLTQFHRPEGSIGLLKSLRFIEGKAREYGLEDIRLIEQPYNGPTYEPISGELWMLEPHMEKLADIAEVALFLADYSRTTHLTAELVDIEDGTTQDCYKNKDVKGKIVLAAGHPAEVMPLAVWKFGAVGVVSYGSTRIDPLLEAPDQVAWSRIPFKSRDGKEGTFAFILSPRQGLIMKNILTPTSDRAIFGRGKPIPQKVVLKVDIETKFHQSRQWTLEAFIRGTEMNDQDIVLTAHAQEEKYSANDNGSGCVSILEIGRAFSRLIREGILPRPRRNIRFWWINEISSQYQLWRDQPHLRDSLLVNINQDMVGAKQSIGSRVQHITTPPLSRHSYLGDVVESIATSVIHGNNAFLSARLQGTQRGSNFPKPMYSRLGTREPYNARIVPYFDFTDHMPFIDGPGGIPGVTFTNWPDEIIHSSDDDLWNVDRTQIKRNAYIVAAAAWYLANVGDKDIPHLMSYMYGKGKSRLGTVFSIAVNHLRAALSSNEDGKGYSEARIIINEAYEREKEALLTVARLTDNRKSPPLIKNFISAYDKQLKEDLRHLDDIFMTLTHVKPDGVSMTVEESTLSKKVPKNISNLRTYFMKRDSVRGGNLGLNTHMMSEVWNFIDGKRSILDIYHAVFAEAMIYGQWYYGNVTLEAVKKLIEEGQEKGVLNF